MAINTHVHETTNGGLKPKQADYMNAKLSLSLEQVTARFNQDEGFDQQSFYNLYEDTGEETVIRIMAHFNQNLKEAARQIDVALKTEDRDSVWKWAHKIAGSAALLGFKSYGDESRELSKKLRDGQGFQEFRSEIEGYLNKTSSIHQNIERAIPTLQSYL